MYYYDECYSMFSDFIIYKIIFLLANLAHFYDTLILKQINCLIYKSTSSHADFAASVSLT